MRQPTRLKLQFTLAKLNNMDAKAFKQVNILKIILIGVIAFFAFFALVRETKAQWCEDYNECTTDTFDTWLGECTNEPNYAPCSDGNVCTEDQCNYAAVCYSYPVIEEDYNVCTDDTCDTSQGFLHTPNNASCSDGEACTGSDVCSNGACVGASLATDANWNEWSEWSSCSNTCGDGTQDRTRTCQGAVSCGGSDNCTGPSSESRSCFGSSSCSYSWQVTGWGACSKPCDTGSQSPTLACIRSDGAVVDSSYCSGITPPPDQTCNTQVCTGAACTDSCGGSDFSGSCTDGSCCVANQNQSCDDGNVCTGSDIIQCNGTCSGNTIPGCGAPVCGDGVKQGTEQCDDGNLENNDGCSAECQEEYQSSNKCGNGWTDPGEQCDDGNSAVGDGCNNSCILEQWAAACTDDSQCQGMATNPCFKFPRCQSGVCTATPACYACQKSSPGAVRTCDGPRFDGYTTKTSCDASCNNDVGGSAQCPSEPGACYTTDDPSKQCGVKPGVDTFQVTCYEINNGNNHFFVTEYSSLTCKGQRQALVPGYSNICQLENCEFSAPAGVQNGSIGDGPCPGGTAGEDPPIDVTNQVICGDFVIATASGEECDDGGKVSGDGCSSTCKIEKSISVSAIPTSQDISKGGNTSYAVTASSSGQPIANAKFTFTSGCPASATCAFDTTTKAFSNSKATVNLNVTNTTNITSPQTVTLNFKAEDASCAGVVGCPTATGSVTLNVVTAGLTADLDGTVWTDSNRNVVWGGYNNVDGPVVVPEKWNYQVSWVSSSATSCTLDGVSVATNGPLAKKNDLVAGTGVWSKTHTLTCTGPGGTKTDTFVISIPPPPTNPVSSCPSPGTTATISWSAPAGYNVFYVRAVSTSHPAENTLPGGFFYYKDNVVGNSVTFPNTITGNTIAGHTYQWWVQTNHPAQGAFSTEIRSNFTCAVPGSDLIAQNLAVSPASPTAGQTLSFSATIKNQGTSPVGGTSATRLRIDRDNNGSWDVNPANQTTGDLAAAATENETWSNAWPGAPAGTHKIEVCADANSQRPETNETNNCATFIFTVASSPPNSGGASVNFSSTDCQEMTVTWFGFTGGTSYNLYRYAGSSLPPGFVVLTGATKFTNVTTPYVDNVAAGTYYYWVTAVNAGGETAPVAATGNPKAANACVADLTTSSKTIEAINDVALAAHSYCSGTNTIPATTTLKLDDKIKFSVNFCNSGYAVGNAGTGTDTFTNLKLHPGTQFCFDGTGASCTGGIVLNQAADCRTAAQLSSGQYSVCGTDPNKTITFNLTGAAFNIPTPAPGNTTVKRLTFEADLAVPAGFTGAFPRFQNSFDFIPTGKKNTPLLLFNVGKKPPSIIEVP